MRILTNVRHLIRVAAFVCGLALIAAACGDDSGTGGLSPAPDDTTPTASPSDDGEPADRSDELVGAWTITTFQLAGALGEAEPVGPDPATIEFAADGTFTFSTGCNTGDGEWDPFGVYQPKNDDGILEGQQITFDGLSQTEIGCEAELGDQDLAIGGAIRATELFILEGSTLTLYRDGNVMIEATR